jgi:hypothetical protein
VSISGSFGGHPIPSCKFLLAGSDAWKGTGGEKERDRDRAVDRHRGCAGDRAGGGGGETTEKEIDLQVLRVTKKLLSLAF